MMLWEQSWEQRLYTAAQLSACRIVKVLGVSWILSAIQRSVPTTGAQTCTVLVSLAHGSNILAQSHSRRGTWRKHRGRSTVKS